jgi:hypothetical protein
MPNHSLHGLLEFGVEGVIGQVFVVKVRANGRKVCHFSHDNSGAVSGVPELKAALD